MLPKEGLDLGNVDHREMQISTYSRQTETLKRNYWKKTKNGGQKKVLPPCPYIQLSAIKSDKWVNYFESLSHSPLQTSSIVVVQEPVRCKLMVEEETIELVRKLKYSEVDVTRNVTEEVHSIDVGTG